MRIPKYIKGFGFKYPVTQKKNYRCLGMINHRYGKIVLEKSVFHEKKESSLLHEILHMVNCESNARMDEEQVDKIATGLYQVLKDNNLLK